jgi:membrane dipeptidase
MLNKMIIVDAHSDLLEKLLESDGDIFRNSHHIDIERMRKYGGYIQFMAACVNPSYGREYAIHGILRELDTYFIQENLYSNAITLCHNLNDIEKALKQEKIGVILTVEGGDILQGDMSVLRLLYRLGVRCMTLTWNYRNEIADGVLDEISGGGLTPFGRDVIKEMNRLGMLIDLSHISEKGFWDVAQLSKAPVFLSHSNAKKLCGHVRNVSDEQLIAVKNSNGVICVNFYPLFLNDSGNADIKDIIRHIEHIAGLIGIDHIGFGSDFDGIGYLPDGMQGVQDLYKVIDELNKLNYSQESIEKIAGKNVLRIIGDVCSN